MILCHPLVSKRQAKQWDRMVLPWKPSYGTHLYIHLALLFNLFIKTGYLPKPFMQALIILLVKSKSGGLTDANNYRAIAVSTAISKLFESIVAEFYHSGSHLADQYQFGFKSGHSTGLCTSILKRTINTILTEAVIYFYVLWISRKLLTE